MFGENIDLVSTFTSMFLPVNSSFPADSLRHMLQNGSFPCSNAVIVVPV